MLTEKRKERGSHGLGGTVKQNVQGEAVMTSGYSERKQCRGSGSNCLGAMARENEGGEPGTIFENRGETEEDEHEAIDHEQS
jgi:hypothetical protein